MRSWMIITCLFFGATISANVLADEVDDLVTQLQSADVFERCYAAEQLAELKDKRAVDPLLKLLTDPMPSLSAVLLFVHGRSSPLDAQIIGKSAAPP